MNEPEQSISVLLPVHAGVDPAHLKAALESLVAQTRPADEVVVVEDGPLSGAHASILTWLETNHPPVVRIQLEHNQGAGVANQAGLMAARGTWIAKADADDINLPTRFEIQARTVLSEGLDVCGAAMAEFDTDPQNVLGVRTNPRSQREIARRMRLNNPINHPTAFYRRETAIRAGGYPPMRFMQDYVLFARMLSHGAVMKNLEDPLVRCRAGSALHERRRAPGFLGLERALQHELRKSGVVGPVRMHRNLVLRMSYRLLPRPLMRWAHHNVSATRGRGAL